MFCSRQTTDTAICVGHTSSTFDTKAWQQEVKATLAQAGQRCSHCLACSTSTMPTLRCSWLAGMTHTVQAIFGHSHRCSLQTRKRLCHLQVDVLMNDLAAELLQPPAEPSATAAPAQPSNAHVPTEAIALCHPLLERFERCWSAAPTRFALSDHLPACCRMQLTQSCVILFQGRAGPHSARGKRKRQGGRCSGGGGSQAPCL